MTPQKNNSKLYTVKIDGRTRLTKSDRKGLIIPAKNRTKAKKYAEELQEKGFFEKNLTISDHVHVATLKEIENSNYRLSESQQHKHYRYFPPKEIKKASEMEVIQNGE